MPHVSLKDAATASKFAAAGRRRTWLILHLIVRGVQHTSAGSFEIMRPGKPCSYSNIDLAAGRSRWRCSMFSSPAFSGCGLRQLPKRLLVRYEIALTEENETDEPHGA